MVSELKSLALDIKVLTEDDDEIKLRDYSDEELDFDAANTKNEEFKEIDIMTGEGNVFGDFTAEKTDDSLSIFDTPSDDDDDAFNIFDDKTEDDITALFGDSSDDKDEE